MALLKSHYRMTEGAPLNVLDFGADRTDAVGSETANDAALLLAVAAVATTGRSLYFPAGTYRVSSALTLSASGTYFGAGRGKTIIKTMHATNDVWTTTASAIYIRDIGFTAGTTRSGGAFVRVASSDFVLEDFYMSGAYHGVRINSGGAIQTVQHGHMRDGVATTGVGILIEGGFDVTVRDIIADHASNIGANIRITGAGDVTLEDLNLIHADVDLDLIANTGSAVITSVWANNCFFDTAGSYGVRLLAATAGDVIVRCIFDQCWMSAAGNTGAVLATGAGVGSVDGIDFVNCHMFLNGANGLDVQGSECKNIRAIGGAYCNNGGSGIALQDGAGLSVIGAKIGEGYGLTGNGFGIFLGDNLEYVTIAGNDVRGNTSAPIAIGTGYTDLKVYKNHGFVTRNRGIATVVGAGTGTTVVVNHGLSATPNSADIQVTPVSGPAGTNQYFWVGPVTSTQFTINVNTDPSSDIFFAWDARVLGE